MMYSSKVKKYLLIVITLFLLLSTACRNRKDHSEETITDETTIEEEYINPDPAHYARNSLDYHGLYSGVLPTASGEGMWVSIRLNLDDTYLKEVRYIGKNEETGFTTKGDFRWNDEGNTITLIGTEEPNKFFVGENVLFHLDMNGERITGELADKYRLIKQQY